MYNTIIIIVQIKVYIIPTIIKNYLTHFCILILSYTECTLQVLQLPVRYNYTDYGAMFLPTKYNKKKTRKLLSICSRYYYYCCCPATVRRNRPPDDTMYGLAVYDCPPEWLLHSAALATSGRVTPSACLHVECTLCSE